MRDFITHKRNSPPVRHVKRGFHFLPTYTESLPFLSIDEWGRLVLTTTDGERQIGVEPVRAFPLSEPEKFISFCDTEGHEIYCLMTIESLSEPQARLLRNELSLREFLPIIERIHRVSGEETPSDWEVITDRGETCFSLENDDDVRRIGPNRVLITDARKLRYQVPDLRELDARSKRLIERYL